MPAVTIEQVKEHIGGVVHCDRAALADPAAVATIRAALEDRGVLVFPRLGLSDEEQLAFTDQLGQRVDYTRQMTGGEGKAPDFYRVSLDMGNAMRPELVIATWFWHIDGAVVDQPLPKATLLSARRLAPTGGQTEFCSTYAAWATLPEAEQQALLGLKVQHRLAAALRHLTPVDDLPPSGLTGAKAPEMIHPLVWTHRDGRRSLVLGSHADEVLGMSLADGRALLARLTEWAAQPDFSYRHEWQEGDFVVWDNCGTMHRVLPYSAECGRMMHRTSVGGEDWPAAA